MPRRYLLTAPGAIWPGVVVSSKSIDLDVEPTDSPLRVTVEPDSLDLDVGDRTSLNVIGQCADGSKLDLEESTSTTFVSESPDIVTVGENGFVTALRPGSTSIVVNGLLKVPVTVKPPVRIEPGDTTLTASETSEFVARVAPGLNQAVTWSISPEGTGSITTDGIYTAPASISLRAVIRLTAHALAGDASAAITLSPES